MAVAVSGRYLRALVALAAATTVIALTAASATARPPQLETVGATPGRIATATWSLPANVGSQFFELANDPEVNVYGYFRQIHLLRFGVLDYDQTALIQSDSSPPLDPGIYYVHVAGHDGVHDGCAVVEFSDILKLTINPDGTTSSQPGGPGTGDCTLIRPKAGHPGGGSVGGGGTSLDKTAPVAQLRYARRQDIDKLLVRGRMSEPGTLTARALVDVGGLLAKIYMFRPSTRKASGGVLTRLPIRVSRKHKRALKRAMRRGKRIRARVILTAMDRAGNTTSKHVTIRLKP